MTYKTPALLAAIAIIAAPLAAAEPEPAPSLEVLGSWQSACDAWGTPATCTATWSEGKHKSLLVQDYTIVSVEGEVQIFSGRGLYRVKDGAVDGIWEDSRGQILPLAGRYEGDTLNVIWGDASSEIGRSVYTLSDDGLRAVDSVLTEDGWRPFMTIEYQRSAIE